jgi:hypothetical protein
MVNKKMVVVMSDEQMKAIQIGIVKNVCGKHGHQYTSIVHPTGEFHVYCGVCGCEMKFL